MPRPMTWGEFTRTIETALTKISSRKISKEELDSMIIDWIDISYPQWYESSDECAMDLKIIITPSRKLRIIDSNLDEKEI